MLPQPLQTVAATFSDKLNDFKANRITIDEALTQLRSEAFVVDASGARWELEQTSDPDAGLYHWLRDGVASDPAAFVAPIDTAETGFGGGGPAVAPPTDDGFGLGDALTQPFDDSFGPVVDVDDFAPAAPSAERQQPSRRLDDGLDNSLWAKVPHGAKVRDILEAHGARIGLALVVVVLAGWFLTRGGDPADTPAESDVAAQGSDADGRPDLQPDPTGETPTADEPVFVYDCPPVPVSIPNLPTGEPSDLVNCLNGSDVNGQTVPGIATAVVTVDAGGVGQYDPAALVTRSTTWWALGQIYLNTPDAPALTLADTQLDGIDPARRNGLLAAAAVLGVDVSQLGDATPINSDELVVWTHRTLVTAGVLAGDPALNDPTAAAATLAAAGLLEPGDHNLGQAATASNWIAVVGRATYESTHPGAGLERTVTPTASAPQDAPTIAQTDVNALIAKLISGDRGLASSAVAAPGDQVALETARFAGYPAAGLTLRAGVPTASSVVLELVDEQNGQTVVASSTVSLTVEADAVLFSTWPQF